MWWYSSTLSAVIRLMVILFVGGGGGGVNHVFVPPLHPNTRLFEKIWVRREGVLNGRSRFRCPTLIIPLEARLDPVAKATHGYLYLALSHYNSLFDKAPGLWQYACLT